MQLNKTGKRSPTIDDVAAEANVSTATVSRALNNPVEVRETLRLRVHEAVRRLGYVPNAGARALMVGTRTVGAVFPTIDHAIFAKGIDALQRRLAEEGLQLLIAASDYDLATEERQVQNLVLQGARGLALCGCGQSASLLSFLSRSSIPCVHVMVSGGPPDLHCVGFDNVKAIMPAVRYLADLGHSRIAMLSGITRGNDRAAARVAGFRQAMSEAQLVVAHGRLVERRYDIAEARDGMRRLLSVGPPPTAVVCGNDVLAQGALFEALSMGLRVPEDLSIVGFDDLEIVRHLPPPLTTVQVPTELMWRTAAEQLLALMLGEDPHEPPPLDTPLIVRASTAKPPIS